MAGREKVATFTVRVSFDPGEGESLSAEVLAAVAQSAAADAVADMEAALQFADPRFEVRWLGSQLVARPLAVAA